MILYFSLADPRIKQIVEAFEIDLTESDRPLFTALNYFGRRDRPLSTALDDFGPRDHHFLPPSIILDAATAPNLPPSIIQLITCKWHFPFKPELLLNRVCVASSKRDCNDEPWILAAVSCALQLMARQSQAEMERYRCWS